MMNNIRLKTLKQFAFILFVTGFALIISACSYDIPTPKNSKNLTTPNLATTQVKNIYLNTLSTLNIALSNVNYDLSADSESELRQRFSGSAYLLYKAQNKLAKATGKHEAYTSLSSDYVQFFASNNKSWPRTLFLVTKDLNNQNHDCLVVYNQQTPVSNYKVLSIIDLFGSISLPSFDSYQIGSQSVLGIDEGLYEHPNYIFEHYSDVLNKGAKSKWSTHFTNNLFEKEVESSYNEAQKSLDLVQGSESQTFKYHPGVTRGLRTSDGGAVVVGQIDSKWTRTTKIGSASLPASDAESAVMESDDRTSTIEVTYANLIAFYIPPKGGTTDVRVLGAKRFPTKALSISAP